MCSSHHSINRPDEMCETHYKRGANIVISDSDVLLCDKSADSIVAGCEQSVLQRGAAGWVKGFANTFLRVPLALFGQHGSCSTGPTVRATLRKMFTKLFTQPAAPRCISMSMHNVNVKVHTWSPDRTTVKQSRLKGSTRKAERKKSNLLYVP